MPYQEINELLRIARQELYNVRRELFRSANPEEKRKLQQKRLDLYIIINLLLDVLELVNSTECRGGLYHCH